ncbi:BTB/POZ domain-containing protein KCTD9-like isoform X3 [Montipora capricornis]|uniref:BTB/POZ domain-containing protein KCTD9-like isoform X3 n=1 Tax=Montipora foliosa TaxID=591990 RepID=UPI0035F17A33
MPGYAQKRVTVFAKGCTRGGKVVAVPKTFEEFLRVVQKKLGLPSVASVFTKNGGLIDDVELIRDDEVLYVSAEDVAMVPCPLHVSLANGDAYVVDEAKSFTDWVTLNVGGQIFTTTRATLMNEPNSMLAKMFSPAESWTSITDHSGAFLIDRSPVYFEPILNYLRHGQLILDNGVNPGGVLEEAKFFGISGILEQLEEMVKATDKSEDAPLSRIEFIKIILSTPSTCELRCQMANLRKTDLTNANLSNCCLERADLSEAHMDGAILTCTRLQRAHMEGASLRGCNFEDPTGTRAHLEGVNLKGSDLEGSNLGNVNLRVATLKGANLQNCNLRGAELAGADLENCNLTGCDLQDANLRGANITGATIAEITGPLHMTAFVRNQLPGSLTVSSSPDE